MRPDSQPPRIRPKGSLRVGWGLNLYVDAGEAGGRFYAGSDVDRIPGGETDSLEEPPDPGRSEEEAARRARGMVRRFCTANRLNRLVTLTYSGEGCHDPKALRVDVAEFIRELRRLLGGEPFPYLWVAEWHKTGHGLHVHLAVGRYVPRRLIEEAWGRGFVHIKLIGDLPVGSGTLEEARKAGRYLGKYAGKDFGHGRVAGLHRYEVAQGFQPRSELVLAPRLQEAVERASERMGKEPSYRWSSSDVEGWDGPPAAWFSWDG